MNRRKPTRKRDAANALPADRLTSPIGRLDGRRVVSIGLGGIGVPVAQAVARFLTFSRATTPMVVVDGDAFEERNRSRVSFSGGGNKALCLAAELNALSDGVVPIVPVPAYVTPYNAHRLIDSGSVVLLAVDNHATRKCVSARCAKLTDVLLISGGNDAVGQGRDGTFGHVMVYERRGGRDLCPRLTRFHPEIAHPADKRPDQLGCAALAEAAPQLLFTNLAVAATMLGVFYAWLVGRLDHHEVYLDIVRGRSNPVRRTGSTSPRLSSDDDVL